MHLQFSYYYFWRSKKNSDLMNKIVVSQNSFGVCEAWTWTPMPKWKSEMSISAYNVYRQVDIINVELMLWEDKRVKVMPQNRVRRPLRLHLIFKTVMFHLVVWEPSTWHPQLRDRHQVWFHLIFSFSIYFLFIIRLYWINQRINWLVPTHQIVTKHAQLKS